MNSVQNFNISKVCPQEKTQAKKKITTFSPIHTLVCVSVIVASVAGKSIPNKLAQVGMIKPIANLGQKTTAQGQFSSITILDQKTTIRPRQGTKPALRQDGTKPALRQDGTKPALRQKTTIGPRQDGTKPAVKNIKP